MTQEVPHVILNPIRVGHDQLVGKTCLLEQQVKPSMIRVHFVKFEFERHGLEAPPFCQHCIPSFQHSYQNYPWWGKLEWKVKVPWLLVGGQQKMLTNFAAVIGVASISGTWQNKQFPDVFLSHNNHKRDPWNECCIHQFCEPNYHSSCKKVGWAQSSAPFQPLKKNVLIWLAQLVEAEALNVMEVSQYQPYSVHEPVPAFQKCCTHTVKCTSFQILQKPVTKPAHGVP